MQDPEAYLDSIGVTLRCPVHRDRDAILIVELRKRIGHETFFFSSPQAMEEFDRQPLRYVDRLTDPVSEERFTPTEHSPVVAHAGRDYYFESEETRNAFRGDPGMYAEPRIAMR